MFAQQRLYLTADKDRLVPEGDEAAATLYASPGDEIPDSAVEMFGLVDGALPDAGSPPPARKPRSAKAAQPGATKEVPAGGNKGASDDPVPPSVDDAGGE